MTLDIYSVGVLHNYIGTRRLKVAASEDRYYRENRDLWPSGLRVFRSPALVVSVILSLVIVVI